MDEITVLSSLTGGLGKGNEFFFFKFRRLL